MLSAVAGALESIGLGDSHYGVCAAHTDTACPHVHVAISRVDPETGRAVSLDKGATKRLSRWAEQYERDHGRIVVPTRVERREARAARRNLERRCRKEGGMQHAQGARDGGATAPGAASEWRALRSRQAEETQRQQSEQAERVERQRREWHATGGPAPAAPRTTEVAPVPRTG